MTCRGDLELLRLHVPQLHESHPPGLGRPAAGDGVQLQHDLHAARDQRLPGGPAALTDLLRTSASARRPASAPGRGGGILPDDEYFLQPTRRRRIHPRAFEQVQLAIGQGAFLGTPLQLANAFAAIGNGGTLWTPRIVTTATLPDGTIVEHIEQQLANEITVDPATSPYVTDTLQAVVTPRMAPATAAFAGFGIPVAGKTGTAESGGPDPHAWFPAYRSGRRSDDRVATVLPTSRSAPAAPTRLRSYAV